MNHKLLTFAAGALGVAFLAALIREEHIETRRVLRAALKEVNASVRAVPENLDSIIASQVENRVASEHASWLVDYLETEDAVYEDMDVAKRESRLAR